MIIPLEGFKYQMGLTSIQEALSPAILYSAEAEKAVLGCMMAQPAEVIDEATVALLKEDFFVPAHQEIFGALREMHNSRQAIDVMTIHQWLTDRKMAEAVGSPGILGELYNSFATHLNVGSYIRIVKDKSLLRCLQMACSTIVQDISEMPDSVPSVIDRAEQAILSISQVETIHEPVHAGKIAKDIVDEIESYDSNRPITGLSTGLMQLDKLTTGWHPGQMIVLAARPGIGKSSLGLMFADTACNSQWSEQAQCIVSPGIAVDIFSLEMSKEEWETRQLAMRSGIPLMELRRRNLQPIPGKPNVTKDDLMQELRRTQREINTFPLYIDEEPALSITRLRSKARRAKAKRNTQLFIVDYLQLLRSISKKADNNRQVEVSEISAGIKALAKELHVPIIVLAQLNRKSEERNDEPQLHNLRESGSIEQDADIVMILHKPDPEKPTQFILNIAKQRNGPQDKIPITFDPHTTLFRN